jgi:hypothetical protein
MMSNTHTLSHHLTEDRQSDEEVNGLVVELRELEKQLKGGVHFSRWVKMDLKLCQVCEEANYRKNRKEANYWNYGKQTENQHDEARVYEAYHSS